MSLLPILALSCFTALVLTPVAQRLGIRYGRIDVPNERSSHTKPTPRTGGYAILAAIAIAFMAGGAWRDGPLDVILVSAILLALLAVVDEVRPLDQKLRLGFQVFVAAAAVYGSGSAVYHITLPGYVLSLGAFGTLASVFWVVGVVNAYNFMDGVNGIASVEAIICGSAMSIMFIRVGDATGAILTLAIAGACAGFLPWNFPSGSIFMGDVGSATIGYFFALLVLRLSNQQVTFISAALPLSPFLLDAGVTLVRRMLNGEAFFSTPHRTHFYQRFNRLGRSHAAVTVVWGLLALVSSLVAIAYDDLSDAGRSAMLMALLMTHGAVGLWITRREHALAGRNTC
jgi:UDP-N-acetylmuramyl pentapeptide phosphotransferase/UDP-N-acetylglucosamine-1-phosphate transferase